MRAKKCMAVCKPPRRCAPLRRFVQRLEQERQRPILLVVLFRKPLPRQLREMDVCEVQMDDLRHVMLLLVLVLLLLLLLPRPYKHC